MFLRHMPNYEKWMIINNHPFNTFVYMLFYLLNTLNSTRRFCARPSAVLLSAIG